MFTCARIKATKGKGADFYRQHLSCNDYFSEHETIQGTWHGSLASAFDLSGKNVDQTTFTKFQQNINPATGEKLTVRNVENSVRFYDFQCSAQKSVSIMALFDPRLAQAHQDAVREAMAEMERFASVRLRSGINANTDNVEFTGNFVYAEYHHDSSRLLDPQLHTHNVIVNVTRDKDGNYKALQTREMIRAIRYASKVYLNALAANCIKCGYLIAEKYRDKGELVGFELKGISDEMLKRCSQRRAQIDAAIEKFVETHGRQPTIDEVTRLTLLTRNRKMLERSDHQVKEYQLSLITDTEKEKIKEIIKIAKIRTGYCYKSYNKEEHLEALRKISEQIFERETVVSLDKILAETLNQNLGKINLDQLKSTVSQSAGLLNLEEPSVNPYITTYQHLEREANILKMVRNTAGHDMPLRSDYVPFSESEDTFDHSKQREVIESIIDSKDKFQIFRGVAGAGKTSTLQELCKCMKKGGVVNIHVIAPTNSAVDVLRTEGFSSAQTVAKFLQDPSTLPPDGSYLIVDESGLNSMRQGHEMMRQAIDHDYRILFVGDERQHSSVEAGDFFRLLEQYSEINRTELSEIHRQQHEEYRHGIELASEGNVGAAFDHLDSHGFIHESEGKYLDEAAKSFLRLTDEGRHPLDCIAAAPTNKECEMLTDKIRDQMKSKGLLDTETEQQVETFRSWSWTKERIGDAKNYQPGMKLFFTTKIKGIGDPGQMAEVASVEGQKIKLTDGRTFYPSQFKDRIDVGEARSLAIAKGDIVRFTVNLKMPGYKINNGSLAIASGRPNEFTLLDHNRRELTTVTLPSGFKGLKYGWVITSHSSQGMTSKNVVVAAEKMSGQAFYVACSRGKKELALHVPEKEFFRDRLVKIPTERKLVSDVTDGKLHRWKAPILPPPAEQVFGARLRSYIKNIFRELHKMERKVEWYLKNAIFHAFDHNIRKSDSWRKEIIRKEFRIRKAALERAREEERQREAERKRAEAERIAAERAKMSPEERQIYEKVEAQRKIYEEEAEIFKRNFGREMRPFNMEERLAKEFAKLAEEKRAAEKIRQEKEYWAAERAKLSPEEQVIFDRVDALRKLYEENAETIERNIGRKLTPFDMKERLAEALAKFAEERASAVQNEQNHSVAEAENKPITKENNDGELERIRREKEERTARLMALAERRKRESPGGPDR